MIARAVIAAVVAAVVATVATAVLASFLLPAQESWSYVAVAVGATAALAFAARHRDVTARAEELQHLNRQLRESAIADSLTGLRNRRFVFEHLGPDLAAASGELLRARQRGEPGPDAVAVLLLVDLDRFKAINDTYGHRVGDEVLVEVAARLRREVRAGDAVIRWGGDEVLIVTRDTSPDAGAAMAERLRDAVGRQPVRLSTGVELAVTCTVGFACYPFLPAAPAAGTWEDVIGFADVALYAAKADGRDSWAGCVAEAGATPEVFAHARHQADRRLAQPSVALRRARTAA